MREMREREKERERDRETERERVRNRERERFTQHVGSPPSRMLPGSILPFSLGLGFW